MNIVSWMMKINPILLEKYVDFFLVPFIAKGM